LGIKVTPFSIETLLMGIDDLSYADVQSDMARTEGTAADIEAKLNLARNEVITSQKAATTCGKTTSSIV
jgi:hypothetical protein